MSDEDVFISNFLKQHEEINDYWLEVPYNRYGSRGFVDAVFEIEPSSDDIEPYYHVCEVKSESAIRNATGANEIIRQVQKMCAYFYEGQENDIVSEDHHFYLFILDTEYNRKHVAENLSLYESIHDTDEVTPSATVKFVDVGGFLGASLHNFEGWVDDPLRGRTSFDLRDPNSPSPISLLNEDVEPEYETFCFKHEIDKTRREPHFKLNGDIYHLVEGFELFYCPKCLIELSIAEGIKPRQFGGDLGKFATSIMTAEAAKEGDVDALEFRELWEICEDEEHLEALTKVADVGAKEGGD